MAISLFMAGVNTAFCALAKKGRTRSKANNCFLKYAAIDQGLKVLQAEFGGEWNVGMLCLRLRDSENAIGVSGVVEVRCLFKRETL
ncbi:hypothetical protein HDV05_003275, partial [Chytridiales sp. JEL 0842]